MNKIAKIIQFSKQPHPLNGYYYIMLTSKYIEPVNFPYYPATALIKYIFTLTQSLLVKYFYAARVPTHHVFIVLLALVLNVDILSSMNHFEYI